MVEEASCIWSLNRKRQIGYVEMQGGQVDRLISVRQSVTLYTKRTGEEVERRRPFRRRLFARCPRHF
jgi:hypothetical protein